MLAGQWLGPAKVDPGVRFGAEQGIHHPQRTNPIDQRMVNLAVNGEAIPGQALDKMYLPQRPTALQRFFVCRCDEL